MQQFTVPQFIDVEPKIIGPITARQFLIFLGAALIIFVLYKALNFGGFILFGSLVFVTAAIFAFFKVNGRPFHYFILNIVQTFRRPSLRVWDHKSITMEKKEEKEIEYENVLPPDKYFAKSRLVELSLIIDTKGKYRGGDDKIEFQ